MHGFFKFIRKTAHFIGKRAPIRYTIRYNMNL